MEERDDDSSRSGGSRSLRMAQRDANGYFEVQPSSSFSRNPETGIYEKSSSSQYSKERERRPAVPPPSARSHSRNHSGGTSSSRRGIERENSAFEFNTLENSLDNLERTRSNTGRRSPASVSASRTHSPAASSRRRDDVESSTRRRDDVESSYSRSNRRGRDEGESSYSRSTRRDLEDVDSNNSRGSSRRDREERSQDSERRRRTPERRDEDDFVPSRSERSRRTLERDNSDSGLSRNERSRRTVDQNDDHQSKSSSRRNRDDRRGDKGELSSSATYQERILRDVERDTSGNDNDEAVQSRKNALLEARAARSRRAPASRSRSRSIGRSIPRDEGGRDAERVDDEDNFQVSEQEQIEFKKQRLEKEKQDAAKKEAERREAEMVAREREKRTAAERERRTSDGRKGSAGGEFALLSRVPVDESLFVSDYLNALMTTLRNDDTLTPVPENFTSKDAYRSWRQDMRRTFQEVLIKMIKYRFIVKPDPRKALESGPRKIYFRVIEARGLIGKDGRGRSTYCDIEFGDLSRSKSKREVFRTDVIEDSLEPLWDQKMTIDVFSVNDEIQIQVFDKKEHFLGRVRIGTETLIRKCSKTYEKSIQEWFSLDPRDSKYRDKYVGGELLLAARIDEEKKDIQSTLERMEVDNRALFDVMLRACLVLDLFSPRDGRPDVLSPEAVNMLKAWARSWNISESYQVISYLKILFEKYSKDSISISDLLKAFHYLYAAVKKGVSKSEMKISIEILEEMKDVCGSRVVKYKELFPKNQPRGSLESTILVLRMIHRYPTYRTLHPELQESFRDEIRIIMTEACISKFMQFKELCAPLDEGDVESVIEGINALADMVNKEIEMDVQYFQPAFAQEIDIVRLTAETLLKYFTLTLEDGGDVLGSESAASNASHHVFKLYLTLRLMAERYAKSVIGLTTMSTSYIEDWFAPFMYKWLKGLSKKTVGWVQHAIRADTFEPEGTGPDGVPSHSSSITDIFVAIYAELEFITNLQWSDPLQNGQFFQAFAKTVNASIEGYCDAISLSEKEESNTTVAAFTSTLLGRKTEPKDIEEESCAKLRNIAFAMNKIREMYKMMNVTAITKNVANHRKTMALGKPPAAIKALDEELVTGAFKIYVAYAENLQPTLKSGSSNPYLLVRVPEGTVVPPEDEAPRKKSSSSEPVAPPQPKVLTGGSCELFRSRYINETLNPAWEETHSVILPPINKLEVVVYSRNLLSFDEVDGLAVIDLSVGTRLRRKLADHQTHDIYLELEPQGRLLLRLTLEGEEEDVAFWFRRTNERLIRTRDAILRSLTAKATPFTETTLAKALKDNEAAPVPASSYFSSLIATVEYSDKTVSGYPINKAVHEDDANDALDQLLEYLEKNLETLCSQLPSLMAQAVIERIWNDVVRITTNSLVPPLFGLHSQKHLNIRQLSMAKWCLTILRDFMHGGGGEFGLPFSTLDTKAYEELKELLRLYHMGLPKLRREYELSLLGGVYKELVLRLVRLVADPSSPDAVWIETQLSKRREQFNK